MTDDFAARKGTGEKVHWGFHNGTCYCHMYTSNTGSPNLQKVSGKVKKANLCKKCFTNGFMNHPDRDKVLERLGLTLVD
jgi:hypothetical protein